jgi:hypothetical protein
MLGTPSWARGTTLAEGDRRHTALKPRNPRFWRIFAQGTRLAEGAV